MFFFTVVHKLWIGIDCHNYLNCWLSGFFLSKHVYTVHKYSRKIDLPFFLCNVQRNVGLKSTSTFITNHNYSIIFLIVFFLSGNGIS